MGTPMMTIRLRSNIRQSARTLMGGDSELSVRKVIKRALDKTAVWARTRVIDFVQEDLALNRTSIRKAIRIRKAHYDVGRLVARLVMSGKRIPLIKFGARQLKKGVSYRIGREGGRGFAPHLFLATVWNKTKSGDYSGHQGVFGRKGKDRLPIVQRKGPSIGHVVVNAVEKIRLKYDVQTRLEQEVFRQIHVFNDQRRRNQLRRLA